MSPAVVMAVGYNGRGDVFVLAVWAYPPGNIAHNQRRTYAGCCVRRAARCRMPHAAGRSAIFISLLVAGDKQRLPAVGVVVKRNWLPNL
jgi:hypothetical protein